MSLNVSDETFKRAIAALKQQQIIAYPTEAVYGLGCDPRSESAVEKILQLKNRQREKGLILIACDITQLEPYLGLLTDKQWQQLKQTWPGAHTWLVPKSNAVPTWIHGAFDTIAVRVTNHPVAAALCQRFGHPLVSTSANRAGQTPLTDNVRVFETFGDEIDYIVSGRVGNQRKPSVIQDLLTQQLIRE